MATNFPSSLDSLSNPTSSDLLDNATGALDHWTQHANCNDAIEALEAKVGADSSAVTTSHDYKLSGVTGGDKAASKTGVETLTNKTLTSPIINVTSDATGDIYYRNSGGSFARLPIGSTDQILKVTGGLPVWASNPTALDSSYSDKGIVKFDTDAATSGVTVTAGVATLNTGTTANKIVKLDASAKLPAVDGSQLTNIAGITYSVNADETLNTYWTQQVPMVATSGTALAGWTLSTTNVTMNAGGHVLLGASGGADFTAITTIVGTGSTDSFSPTQNKTIRIKTKLRLADTSDRKGFGLCVTAGNIHTAQTDTTNGEVRFVFNGSTLYAQNANGSSATSTDISSGLTLTDYNLYEIVFQPGTSIKFYVNGTLKATHTTNLPTSGTLVLAYGASANGRTMTTLPPVISVQI